MACWGSRVHSSTLKRRVYQGWAIVQSQKQAFECCKCFWWLFCRLNVLEIIFSRDDKEGTRGHYQRRWARGTYTGVAAWPASANVEATCCWCLYSCPTPYLTLQKEPGQCSRMQNRDWCVLIYHLPACCCTVCM